MNRFKTLFFTIAVTALIFSYFYNQNEKSFNHAVHEQLAQTNKLDLSKATDFEWDEVAIFGPYSFCEDVNKTIGTDYYDCSKDFVLDMSDSFSLLVFLKNKQVVQTYEVSRDSDFADTHKLIKKENALFTRPAKDKALQLTH